jgi:ferredoxin-NADP reductase
VAEDLHRHRAVEHHPAAREDEDRALRDVRAQLAAEVPELRAQHRVDLRVGGHGEVDSVPQLEEQDVKGPRELERALRGDIPPPVVEPRHGHAEQQGELVLVVQRPAAELTAGGDHLQRDVVPARGVACES